MQETKSIIVSFSKSTENDSCILLVGEKNPKKDVEVINYFAGAEQKNFGISLLLKRRSKNGTR